MGSVPEDEPPRERKRIVLKPRDEAAAAKAAVDRANSGKSNPFGAAKPREAVLAVRQGKDEKEILLEEVKKERLHLRLTQEQLDEKAEAESSVEEIKSELAMETDALKQGELKAELATREDKLAELLDGFEKMAIDRVKSGDIIRPSERRRQAEMQQGAQPGGFGARLDVPGGGRGGASFGGGRSGGRGGYDYGGPRQLDGPGYQSQGFSGYNGGGYEYGSQTQYEPQAQGGTYGGGASGGSYDQYGGRDGGGRGGAARGRSGAGYQQPTSPGSYDRFAGGYDRFSNEGYGKGDEFKSLHQGQDRF